MEDIRFPNIRAVTKSRYIVKESYSLGLAEHRLMLSCISQIDRRMPVPDVFRITAKDYAHDWPESRSNVYRELESAANTLYERDIKLNEPDKNGRQRLRWVQSVSFFDKEGIVELRFSDAIRPFLGELKDNYVQFRMNEISGFKSKYSIRLFELLMQFKKNGFYIISTEDFIKALSLEGHKSYQRYSQLKQKILTVAIDEINKKSGWQVDLVEVKKGRTVTSLRFHFIRKNQMDLFK